MWKHESRCVLPQQTFQSVTILDFTELCYHLVVKMKSPGWTGLWPQTASAGMFFFADCSSVQGHMWLLFLVPFKYRLPLWMPLWLTEWVFLIQGLTQIGKSFFKNLIKMFHRQSVCVYVLIFMFILHIYLSLCISSTPVQQHWSALFIVRCVFPYGLICCSVSVPDWSPSFVFQRCIWSGFVCFGFSWCFVVQYIENLFKKNTATKCNLNFTSRRFLLYLKN